MSLFYIDNADKDLLIFALHNFNEVFLSHALKNSIIGTNLLSQPEVIQEILGLFETGSRSELLLNVLLLSDFNHWEQTYLRQLLDILKEIVEAEQEQNKIILCYNPVLAIALSCEFLDKIANTKNIFRHECKIVKE